MSLSLNNTTSLLVNTEQRLFLFFIFSIHVFVFFYIYFHKNRVVDLNSIIESLKEEKEKNIEMHLQVVINIYNFVFKLILIYFYYIIL